MSFHSRPCGLGVEYRGQFTSGYVLRLVLVAAFSLAIVPSYSLAKETPSCSPQGCPEGCEGPCCTATSHPCTLSDGSTGCCSNDEDCCGDTCCDDEHPNCCNREGGENDHCCAADEACCGNGCYNTNTEDCCNETEPYNTDTQCCTPNGPVTKCQENYNWGVSVSVDTADSISVCRGDSKTLHFTASITGTPPSSTSCYTITGPTWSWSPSQNINVDTSSAGGPTPYTATATATYSCTAIGNCPCPSPLQHQGDKTVNVTVVEVAKIQWNDDGTWKDAGTLTVCKGDTISFKAIPTPSNASWPANSPVWGGTSGASGTGETKSVTFNTVSSSTSDYKTVTAKCCCGTPVTVNVLVVDVDKIIVNGSNPEDEGPKAICFGGSVTLRAKPNPSNASFPSGKPDWSIFSKPDGSTLADPADGSVTATITPDVPGQYTIKASCCCGNTVSFTIVAVKIDIKWGDTIVSDGQTHDSIVGLYENLTVVANSQTGHLTDIQWTVPGTAYKNWIATTTSTTLIEQPQSDDSETLLFYWVDGGTKTVTVSGTYPLGQNHPTCSAAATFNVKRPTITVITTMGTVAIRDSWLRCGDLYGITGIELTRGAIPGDTPGSTEWVQVISHILRRRRTYSTQTWERLEETGVLDTSYPYTTNATAQDSPAEGLWSPWDKKSVEDHFSMYLMYKPNVVAPASSAQWVPLKVTDWAWAGEAEYKGTPPNWTLNSSTDPAATTSDTTTYPAWNGNVVPITWVPE